MKANIKKAKKNIIKTAATSVAALSAMQSAVYADIQDSVLATGTTKLIQDMTNWITGLGIGCTVLMVVYCLIRRNMADEMDHKKWQTRMTVSLVSGVGVTCASAIINVIMGYYGG